MTQQTDQTPQTPPAEQPAGKPPSRVHVTWRGDRRFEGGRASGGPTILIDNDAQAGPGPVDTLLMALAACTAEDVLSILEKRRTPATSLRVAMTGTRRNGVPARLTHIQLDYVVEGEGIDRPQALRAIELAVTKYCSVRDSLDPNLPVEWSLELNGER